MINPDYVQEGRSYREDLIDLDRGNYIIVCVKCRLWFQGYKRRRICKACKIARLERKVKARTRTASHLRNERAKNRRKDEEIRLLRNVVRYSDMYSHCIDSQLFDTARAALAEFDRGSK